jgi:hypothetical protein
MLAMTDTFHDLDPNGDVILIVQESNVPFAVWTGTQDSYTVNNECVRDPEAELGFGIPLGLPRRFQRLPQPPPPVEEEDIEEPEADEPAEETSTFLAQDRPEGSEESIHQPAQGFTAPTILTQFENAKSTSASLSPRASKHRKGTRFRVSSRHLILASPHFKRMLESGFKEGHTLMSNGTVELNESDWDPQAVLILMDVIHGRTRKVPRTVTLEMLAKLAVLADYYECHEIVEVWVELWIHALKVSIPKRFCRDLVLWICISWVFRQPEQFREATATALRQSKEPIPKMSLPIPEGIIGAQ